MKKQIMMIVFMFLMMSQAEAVQFAYPAWRYENVVSDSMGGVSDPLTNEIGNDLMNNPAALAKNTRFKMEPLNLTLEANNNMLGSAGMASLKMTGLSGTESTLNANQNQLYGGGYSNMSAFAWGGLGVGVLIQQRSRAYSDGTHIDYQNISQTVPTIGYGFALARGVVRVGYSLQFVNEAVGTAQTSDTNSSASYVSGISEGHGFSQNASVNFALPFTYLPTLTIMGRNLGGLHYTSGSFISTATNTSGLPTDERMSVDASFDFMVRISGEIKSHWYLQYKDFTMSDSMPFLERLSTGIDISITAHVSVRAGITGDQFSAGLGYQSDSSEINLAWYHEQTPFPSVAYWDTRYALQYKIYFQDKNTKSSSKEAKLR